MSTLQVSADQRGVEFLPNTNRGVRQEQQQGQATTQNPTHQLNDQSSVERQRYNWLDESGNIRPVRTLGGVKLSEQQQADFSAGKPILVEGMVSDKTGREYTAYVKFNFKEGRPNYTRHDPSQAKSITPTEGSKTQVAVNNDGKTNEATKHQQKPLDREQIAPKNSQQQQRRKGGVTM